MKRFFLILLFGFISICACFAARNVGDYTLDEVEDSLCSDFVIYLKDMDLIDDYLCYGIYKTSEGFWYIELSDLDCDHDLFLTFRNGNVEFLRISDVNYSNIAKSDLLKAINGITAKYDNWSTFYVYNDLLISCLRLSSKGITVKMLSDELSHFKGFTKFIFSEIAEEVKVK